MIPLTISPHHLAKSATPGLQPATTTPRISPPSVADWVGLGLVLIITILVCRQFVVCLHQQYQLHRIIVSLQRRATLERQFRRKFVPLK